MPSPPTNAPPPSDLPRTIAETLAYADVFDYPLTVGQIRRYLVRMPATRDEVQTALVSDPWLTARVELHGEWVCLAGRSHAIPLRLQRGRHAEALWPSARILAALVARFPFVRMVAITGSLTMDNVRSARDDVDLFIITAPGRVWLARKLILGLVRLAAILRLELCPNYLLSTERLAMPPDDLFTAHELAQMAPLYGRQAFADLLAANSWLREYLPNAEPRDEDLRDAGPLGRGLQRLIEWPLSGALGDRLERRLQTRKIAKLHREAQAKDIREVILDPDVCKGHMNSHGHIIQAEYSRRAQFLAAETGDLAGSLRGQASG